MQTYSMQDVNVTISHPAVGVWSGNGTGLDSIVIDYAQDNTTHDVAGDGTVMVNKIITSNGSIVLDIQQTGDFNAWLLRWFNYIKVAPPSQWALASVTVSSNNLGQVTYCSGVAPLKAGQRPYKSQGQKVAWTLLAQNVVEV